MKRSHDHSPRRGSSSSSSSVSSHIGRNAASATAPSYGLTFLDQHVPEGHGVVQPFLADIPQAAFEMRRRLERAAETKELFQRDHVGQGGFDLMRTRFDLSNVPSTHRAHVGRAFSGESGSASLNMRMMSVANDLLGRMFRNVERRAESNFLRSLANASGNRSYQPFRMSVHPTSGMELEDTRLDIAVDRAAAPHYNHETNSISLMNPDQLDQTAHELEHAHDHIHGNLDLSNPSHRIASELNAFTQQKAVSRELTGSSPPIFERRTPKVMARTYEGKTEKGYEGTLASSLEAVKTWRNGKR